LDSAGGSRTSDGDIMVGMDGDYGDYGGEKMKEQGNSSRRYVYIELKLNYRAIFPEHQGSGR